MPSSQKNYLSSSLWLVIIVIFILFGLHYIPAAFTEKYHLKPVDILGDIKASGPNESFLMDSLSEAIPEPPKIDTCRADLTCFDDYSPNYDGLDHFYKAISNIHSLSRPVRIAFFGDSFIEGDIFSGDLREELQETYGGKGVGMMPLISSINYFRRTAIHNFGDWKTHSFLDYSDYASLGISGHVFTPGNNPWVYYQGSKRKSNLDTCQQISILYSLKNGTANVSYKINKTGESGQLPLKSTGKVERLDISSDKIGSIHLSFPQNNQLALYGVSMQNKTGIVLDNYSIRGISGSILKQIPEEQYRQFDQLLHYDLIIMQYGLNVMEANRTGYKAYKEDMVEMVRHMQKCFPNSSFLLIGISDRSMKKNGAYETMPSVHAMITAQKGICAETGIVFWNLFEAMGGENSMIEFVKSKPPKANKDYTHLTFEGGEYLGKILSETIQFGVERYQIKKEYFEKYKK